MLEEEGQEEMVWDGDWGAAAGIGKGMWDARVKRFVR